MKLRIKGDTIRIRLSEPEVNLLSNSNSVIEETHFPSSVLTYKVQSSMSTTVDFRDNTVLVSINKGDIASWADSDQVAISTEIPTGNDNILSILVEKDFKCLTVRPEDESNLYTNPNTHHC